MRMSQQHQAYFASLELDPERREMFNRLTKESLAGQQAMEGNNEESFADYLQRYFAQQV